MPANREQPRAASLPQVVRAAGGSLPVEEAARVLFRTRGDGGDAGRRAVLALAAEDPGLSVIDGRTIRLSAMQRSDTSLKNARFVVVDVETTGSRPGEDRITEVGAVLVEKGRIGATFETLVRPDRAVPPAIARLTGIHELLLAGAPRFARVAGAFIDFVGNRTLVAHNAAFDSRFLTHELRLAGHPPLRNRVLCTLKLSRRLLSELPACHLDALAAHFGFRFRARHRALGDAEVTARILVELLRRAEEGGAGTLDALHRLGRRRSPRAPV